MLGTLVPHNIRLWMDFPTACCADPIRGLPPSHAVVSFALCTKWTHTSSPDRLDCYLCLNTHQCTVQSDTGPPAGSLAAAARANLQAAQALGMRPGRAGMVCSCCLNPLTQCLLQGSQCRSPRPFPLRQYCLKPVGGFQVRWEAGRDKTDECKHTA